MMIGLKKNEAVVALGELWELMFPDSRWVSAGMPFTGRQVEIMKTHLAYTNWQLENEKKRRKEDADMLDRIRAIFLEERCE